METNNTLTAETRTFSGHIYQLLTVAPDGVRWDSYGPATPGTLSFGSLRGKAECGPGATFARTTDLSTVGADGRYVSRYWQLVR